MRKQVLVLVVLLTALFACAASADAAQRVSARTVSPPALDVTGASLMVAGGQQLWSYNGDRELAIASTTKMMTALVVLQHVKDLNTTFTQNDWDADAVDSQIGLRPGETMTVHDLLVALLLPSADDAAEDLAYNVGGGSVPKFVAMMNADAQMLGLKHTHYTTPSGLDTPGNYSSPDDLVRLGDYMMRNWPFFRQTVGLASATLTSGRYERHVVNTDDLLTTVPWIQGIKTGHTNDAGYVLVSQGTRDGLTLISSVLGTTSESQRDASALALLKWGFAQYRKVTPVTAGEQFARPQVPYESAPAVVVAKRGYQTVVLRTVPVKVLQGRLRKLSGPMAKGTVVGHARVLVAGHPAVRIPLVLAHALPAVSMWKKADHFLKRPFTLLGLALVLGGAGLAIARRRRPRVLASGRVQER
jgi:serine-type D-Ala-D-Ala carboxypeptidase (penicillin-binding protein 5/6)